MKLDRRIVHDLRAPLTAIEGYCHLMLDGTGGEVNDRQRSYLHAVIASSRVLHYLFSLMSAVDSRDDLIDETGAPLAEILRKSSRALARSFEAKKVTIEDSADELFVQRGATILEAIAAGLLLSVLHTVKRSSVIAVRGELRGDRLTLTLAAEGVRTDTGLADSVHLIAEIASRLDGTFESVGSGFVVDLPGRRFV